MFYKLSFIKLLKHLLIAAIFHTLIFSLYATAQDNFINFPILPMGYTSIKVFDNQNKFVGRILPEKRYWVTLDRIPIFLQQGVIAVEDARFYQHGGIDIRGIARALMKDVVKRRFAEGGSTITQQLIKNRYLTGEKSMERKLDEARMAIEFEQKYSKKQILEMYFNEIYYGNGAWGIAQAARLYFDKRPEELNEAECAILAGVQKNPARYNPLSKAVHVTGRRDIVLKRMVDLEIITPKKSKQIRTHPPAVTQKNQAPQYLALIRSKLIERYGADIIEQGGLEVTAAMNLKFQKSAELALRDGVKKISPTMQGALMTMELSTGDVLAAVGGTDIEKAGYNRVFSAKRQPGSSIKPFIYAAAIEKGISADSIWNDTPAIYNKGNGETWKPLNYGKEEYGDLSLREALAYSNNVIAVKLLEAIGIPALTDLAGKTGLQLREENGLSLALGTSEVTLNELIMAYTPFANGGIRSEPRFIIRIYDKRRNIWSENPPVFKNVISTNTAYTTTQMLKDVFEYGTAKNLNKFSKKYPSAGKTGTTDDYRDAWFLGYTPQIITGVWVGYDRPKSGGKGFTGGAVAAPIWEKIMRKTVASRISTDFVKPEITLPTGTDSLPLNIVD